MDEDSELEESLPFPGKGGDKKIRFDISSYDLSSLILNAISTISNYTECNRLIYQVTVDIPCHDLSHQIDFTAIVIYRYLHHD